MGGTVEGAKRAAKVNNQRTELTIDGKTIKIEPGTFYQVVGKIGGGKSRNGGFGAGEEGRKRAAYYGRIGGMKSKRKKSVQA